MLRERFVRRVWMSNTKRKDPRFAAKYVDISFFGARMSGGISVVALLYLAASPALVAFY